MKKIIFILLAFISLSASAEIIRMDLKNLKQNELFIDEMGKYRYRRAEEVFREECNDIFVEEIKKKCMEAERARWARGKTDEEVNREGTLFTGKIQIVTNKGEPAYYYINQGEQGERIHLKLDQYYFENDILYDIKTEEPVSGEIVIGGVKGLSSKNGKAPRFIVQQKYEEGKTAGNPVVVPVK